MMLDEAVIVKVLCHETVARNLLEDRSQWRYNCELLVSASPHPSFSWHVVTIRSRDVGGVTCVVELIRRLNSLHSSHSGRFY